MERRPDLISSLALITLLILGFILLSSDIKKSVISLGTNIQDSEESEQVLLGRAELSYAGGTAGRMRNIELGLARIDGTVVEEDAEFSFGEALGSIGPEDGFSEERAFLNNEVVLGLGGGLCQASTILFQAALDAGLPITERHSHSFSVIYYREGLDATYAEGGPDLKFRNDTGHSITVRARTENQIAMFEIYGVDDGRQVEIGEVLVRDVIPAPYLNRYIAVPELLEEHKECANNPQSGYTAEVPYIVTLPSGEKREEKVVSIYRPLQRVCYVQAIKPYANL